MEDITKTSVTLDAQIWSSLGLHSMDNTNERFKQGSNQTVLNITQPDGTVIQNITLNESGFDFAGNFALSQILRNTDLTSMKTYTDTKVASVTKSSLGLGNVENKSSATIRGELTSANVTTALGFTPTSLALGETSTTAYRGDRGKTAYDHSQVKDGTNPHATTFANIASKPTTISGYGITDAKIANGVVTLGANTITPLTASSSLDATKLAGTASISTTGNAATATTANALKGVTATATELNYVKGVTSNIQTQLNAKASSSDVVTLSTNQTINADKTVNGYLKVQGTAAERHLITRGVGGCSEDCTTADDLYINYGQDYGARFGKSGQGQLKSDGSIVCTNINGYTIASNVPANAKFTDTTYSAASTSAAGLMSAADKTKLDGIATGANKYTLPVATSSALGGIKSGTDITVDSNGNVSVNDNSHNHNASNISAGTLSSDRLPTVPITKGGTGATTAAAALTNLGLTATATELNYVDGVTSNIQTQLNAKATITKYTATIPATGWTATAPFYVDVTVSGITANDTPNVTITYSGTLATDQARKDSWNKIDRIVTSANKIRVYAFEEVPTTAVPIQLVVVR